jgi:signal transduction protein with GAF and PtsI domain
MSDSLSALPAQPSTEDWAAFLRQTLADFDCVTGTLHRLDPADNLLKLVACERIPEVLMPVIQTIPVGKGVAGAAAERKEPVELCNLQTDTSGVAKPDAKKTQVQGSLAVPVLGEGGKLCGTLGIGKMVPHDFTDAEKEALMNVGRAIAARLG